ncbi:hypothetical protein OG203_17510 [Nocardia sp. NBC_01499]|uniref:hypothetical protein n=1 Tax=Nocardia sp. NBC_01499 TaxID=2903597 RepID=UPI003870A307
MSKDIDARAVKGPTTPYDGNRLPGDIGFQLDEINAMQNAAMADRDTIQNDIAARSVNMQVEDGVGGFRPVTLDDFTDSNLKETIGQLSESEDYDPNDIELLEKLAGQLIDERASISALSEVRGQVGGDYVAGELGIETIYQGSGNYDTDRLGIQTLPDGTKRPVLVEEKGGLRPTYGTRGVDVGGPKKINAQQGSVPYGVDEFRTGSPALQALVDYDAEHGTTFANDLVEGKIDFGYLGVHTEPGTNNINVVEFVPGAGKAFNLDHPGTGQKAPTLPPPTQPVPDEGSAPSDSAIAGGPRLIADERPVAVPGQTAPVWMNGLVASAAPWVSGLASLTQPRNMTVDTLKSAPVPRDLAQPADQTLTVNLAMRTLDTLSPEVAHVLTYASSIR